MKFRANQLKPAIEVLGAYIESKQAQEIKALKSPSVTPESAFEAALQLRCLDQLYTKLKADLKAVERKSNQQK